MTSKEITLKYCGIEQSVFIYLFLINPDFTYVPISFKKAIFTSILNFSVLVLKLINNTIISTIVDMNREQ